MVDFSNAMNLVTNHMGGFLGSGVSFVDFNNDGYEDITFGHHSGDIKFFVGNGNDFEEVELDIDNNGQTDVEDLLLLLIGFGSICTD